MITYKKIAIEYRHYSLPLNFPLLLLTGDLWRISDKKSDSLHFHNCLEIGICHTDSGTIEIGKQQFNFKAGDITCIPRHLPHTTYSETGTESLWSFIFVDPEELFKNTIFSNNQNYEDSLINPHISQYIMNRETYPKLYYWVSSIIKELEKKNPDYQTSTKGLLLSAYIELLRIQADCILKSTPAKQIDEANQLLIISNALDHIHKNYKTPTSVDELAKLCHLSVSHFRRTFHDIMGAAPLDFLNSTRIDEACRLLRSTEDSIVMISEQVGFNSISSFNRCFTKLMGTSPHTWRKKTILSEATSSKASILEFTGWIR